MKEVILAVNNLGVSSTMSSDQLACLLSYEKKEINRKIKNMFKDKIDGGVITPSLDSRGYVSNYHLPELESKMFVAKYDIDYLEKITQYWIDKNSQQLQPVLPDFTNPAKAAIAWAEQYEQKEKALLEVKEKEKALEIAAPKVEFFDEVAATTGVSSIGDLAKSFNVGRNKLFSKLREMNILQRNNVPYQRFIGGGYFQVKESVGYNHINYTTYVTGKGQTWLHKKLKELAFI